jgi:hypothetical protein
MAKSNGDRRLRRQEALSLKALMLLTAVEHILEHGLIEPGPTADWLRKRAQEFRAEIAD